MNAATLDATEAEKLRDPKKLWVTFCMFVMVATFMSVLAVGASIPYLYLSEGDPNWFPVDYTGQILLLALVVTSFGAVGAMIASIVMTLWLTYRLMRNLHRIASPHVTVSPFWSIGFYFIPFANLVMPPKAVGEIFRGTYAETEGEAREPKGAVGWWWAFWLISSISENIANRLLGNSFFQEPTMPSTEALYAGMALYGVSAIAVVIACVFMLLLFGKLVKAQSAMVKAVKERHASAAIQAT
jgi:hypothetical protein